MPIQTINPTTGEELSLYPETSAAELESFLQRAHVAFNEWRRTDFKERAERVKAAANVLRANQDGYAKLMAQEMGKPVSQGRAEIEKCAWVCDHFAENGPKYLARELIPTEIPKSFVTFEPLGILLAVMPWNFPFWQVFRCAAPTLMAGNSIVLKHASNVPSCALAIEEIFREAGFPAGLFRTVLIGSKEVEALIDHQLVRAVTLTGSVAAGRAIAARAGAQLKKTVLELGGSDPYVVLEDCDLEKTVQTCVQSRLINSGQSCIAAKRFIVVEPLRAKFEELFVAGMEAQIIGDPLQEKTTIGPLARRDLRDGLHAQVSNSVDQGARLLTGGTIPAGHGWFYPPTVLTNVGKGMAAYQAETFGPVAAIIAARGEQEAIRIANDSSFGLGAAVFTQDRQRGERIATTELEAGSCFVNDFVKSDPRLPFGGIKNSGYGRELSSFGIREFVNIKTVCVR
jgi:succinate-semialdehyde dehydrogenase / glutarate-semialdehyde dehydrogenase